MAPQAAPSPVPFARSPRCPCRSPVGPRLLSQAALRTAWAASSPGPEQERQSRQLCSPEEGWSLALASCSIGLSCFIVSFSRQLSLKPLFSKLPPSCYSFPSFYFKLGTTSGDNNND